MGAQEAVDLGDVHPAQQVRVRGAVGLTVGGRAAHRLVDGSHPVTGFLRASGRPVGGDGQEGTGPLQPSPRISAEPRMPGHGGHGQRMERLEQQGRQTADEHRGVPVHPPDGPLGAEPAGTGCAVNARPVARALRTRHAGEDLPADPVAQRGAVLRKESPGHRVLLTRATEGSVPYHFFCPGSAFGGLFRARQPGARDDRLY